MKYEINNVMSFMSELNLSKLSAQEIVAVGRALQQIGETKKETDYLNEYMQAALMEADNGTMQ